MCRVGRGVATCGFSLFVITPRHGSRLYTVGGGLPGGEGRLTVRKTWIVAAAAVSSGAAFMMALVIGVYLVGGSATSGVGGAGRALAKGAVPAAYRTLVEKWGNLCSAINPALLAAQLYQESGFNPRAQSAAAAQGIAQFIPGTWATHGIDGDGDGDRDVWDPNDAIPSAASYDCQLASYVKDVPGDATHNMLASYNAGAYAVIKYGGVPPYKETRNYVKTITTLAESFAAPVSRVDPSEQAAGAIYYAQKKLGTPYLWGGNGTADQGDGSTAPGCPRPPTRASGSRCRGSPTTSTTRGRIRSGASCCRATWCSSPPTRTTRGPSTTWGSTWGAGT